MYNHDLDNFWDKICKEMDRDYYALAQYEMTVWFFDSPNDGEHVSHRGPCDVHDEDVKNIPDHFLVEVLEELEELVVGCWDLH